MRPLSYSAGRVTAKICSRKFVALGRVLRHWEDIVGADLAAKAQPVRLTYRRTKGKDKPTATLHIATTPAQSTALHYQSGVILERINQVFGERWIARLAFVVHHSAEAPKPARPAPGPAAKAAAAQIVADIQDADLRAALQALGAGVMGEQNGHLGGGISAG